jgi:hypothetical protein
MSNRKSRLTFVVIGVCAAMCGCATTISSINEQTPYPASWPAIDSSRLEDGCPNRAGTYENVAFAHTADSVAPQLSRVHVFTRLIAAGEKMWGTADNKLVVPLEASSVSFSQAAGSLRASFGEPGGARRELEFHRVRWRAAQGFRNFHPFECKVGSDGPQLRFVMRLDQNFSHLLYFGASGEDTTITLFKAMDGSLVLRWQVQTTLAPLWIPIPLDHSVWVRFRSLPEWWFLPPKRRGQTLPCAIQQPDLTPSDGERCRQGAAQRR